MGQVAARTVLNQDQLLENRPVQDAAIGAKRLVLDGSVWIAALALAFYVAWGIGTNSAMRWDSIARFFTAPIILQGLVTTIVITFCAALIGLVGGLVVALMRMSPNPLIRTIAIGYLGLFRAVPLLVQILIWYNLGTFLPQLGLGIPFTSIGIYGDTNALLSPFVACLVALGQNQAAYMGEIIRGGILSVQAGQVEAAVALGMTKAKAFRRVVAPLAAKS
ncbi:MAG: transporter permease, partial [Devosia sp.]|nr:transporter permease [Devosia sp.]